MIPMKFPGEVSTGTSLAASPMISPDKKNVPFKDCADFPGIFLRSPET